MLHHPTSPLHNDPAAAIPVARARSAHPRTTLSVAHRLARVRNADAIHVLEGGRLVESGTPTVIDVRSAAEYAEQHVEKAIHIPLEDLAAGNVGDLPSDKTHPLITVCNVGEKSLYAMLLLKSLGYQNVKNILGGLNAWVSEGMPTESS